VCSACTIVDISCFNLFEFGYWSIVLCIYCGPLNNFYCTGQLHLAEIPWSLILVLKKLWRNLWWNSVKTKLWRKSLTSFHHNWWQWRKIVTEVCHNLRHNLLRIPSQSSKKQSSQFHHPVEIVAEISVTIPKSLSQNICDGKNSDTNVDHNKLWRKPIRHNCDGPVTI